MNSIRSPFSTMRAGALVSVLGLLLCHGGTSARAEETPADSQIERWIAQLGDDSFVVRQAAAERLVSLGMSAHGPLAELTDDPDPEIRAAARRLVSLIDRTEFGRRLEAFAADVDGQAGVALPGWEEFRELVGDDAVARALFVDMQRQEAALIAAFFDDEARPSDQVWEERLMRLVQWQVRSGRRAVAPPLGSCATMLFLGSLPDTNVSDRSALWIESLITRSPLRESLQAGNHQDALRRLVVAWIVHCPNRSETAIGRRLNLASAHNLKEAVPLAVAVAVGEDEAFTVSPSTRATAVLAVGQLGGREHVDQLEPLLEDTTVCLPPQAGGQVQVRDVTLVVLLHLTGQNLGEYGFVNARRQGQGMFNIGTLQLPNDAQRAAAIEKWREWKAGQ